MPAMTWAMMRTRSERGAVHMAAKRSFARWPGTTVVWLPRALRMWRATRGASSGFEKFMPARAPKPVATGTGAAESTSTP